MAEERVKNVFEEFDVAFEDVQPGEIKKMNVLIAKLTNSQKDLQEVGAASAEKGNALAEGFNNRMDKLKTLSQKKAPPKPQPQAAPVTVNATPAAAAAAPAPAPAKKAGAGVKLTEPTEIAFEIVAEPTYTPPPHIEAALLGLDSLYSRLSALSQMDVWTGKSNDLVSAWNSWQSTHGKEFVSAVSKHQSSNQRLASYAKKYQEFSPSLSKKISSLQINDHQKAVIERFHAEYQGVVDAFRAKVSEGPLKTMESFDQGLKALNIPNHPSVEVALQNTSHALLQMKQMLGQAQSQ
eukprot:TRINITY_DN13207_c0_g1_i1.p1 TRINITY_DN13207_c0_g1~~TRINITY_DN13207_c0_g1_i1.p1  ORF type:complete len:294 (+),score=93.55 TRINITY_DN13207_c0_g1_i1:115-996(+)